MAATLWRSEIGTEGYAPGTLLLQDTVGNFSAITAAGYLNKVAAASSVQPRATDILFAAYSGGVGVFTLSVAGDGTITLEASESHVITPTIANHIAVFTDTAGTIGEDAATAINGGNIQAGLSGTAGYLAAFPGTASKGSLRIAAVANTGNTLVTLSNDAHGQASVYSIPDCGNAAGQILNAATATPFTSGHLPAASGTVGLMVDSGVVAANVISTTSTAQMGAAASIKLDKGTGVEAANAVTINHQAGVITSSSLTVTAGSTYVITLSNTFIATSSVVQLQWMGGSNALANFTMSATAGSNSSVITIYNNDAVSSISGTVIIGFSVF